VKPSRVLLALAMGALVVPLVGRGGGATTVPTAATVSVLPRQVAPGDEVAVRLVGWPTGVVTGSICGNEARRDSQDCDLVGSESVAVGGPEPTAFSLKATVPPAPCPCVVRVTTQGGDVVQTAPLDIAGVPVGPVVGPAPVPADSPSDPVPLVVHARVSTKGARFPESWYGPLGGPARRTLLLTIANHGTSALNGLRFVASAGRGRDSAAPVASRRLAPIAAGAAHVIRIPLDLAAPAFGNYVVFGSVYGLDAPVPFSAKASNEPWGLELLLPVLLLVLAQLARRRERRERAALQQSSSGVESLYNDRSSANGWIPRDAGPAVEEYAYAVAAPPRPVSA